MRPLKSDGKPIAARSASGPPERTHSDIVPAPESPAKILSRSASLLPSRNRASLPPSPRREKRTSLFPAPTAAGASSLRPTTSQRPTVSQRPTASSRPTRSSLTSSLPPLERASAAPPFDRSTPPAPAPALAVVRLDEQVENLSAVDTIIQSSTVEILRSYDVSVAPRGRMELVGHVPASDVVGIIGFEGEGISGNLVLAVPTAVCNLRMPRRPPNTTHAEWTYELTSQVMGRIKNRLIQFQVKLRTHLPTVLSGKAVERYRSRSATEVLYRFLALRGEITVAVDASLTRAKLEYSNAPLVVGDNQVLIFD